MSEEITCEFHIKLNPDSKEFQELIKLLDKWYDGEKKDE